MNQLYELATPQIQQTLNRFHACTCLPIHAITKEGYFFYSIGAPQRDIHRLETEKIINLAYSQFANSDTASHVVFTFENQDYVACYISQTDLKQGVFIFGPYDPRPLDCIPHLVTLLRNLQEEYLYKRPPITCQETSYSLHVQKALSYVARNYNKPLTLDSMAKHLKINKSYFATILKQETGQTFTATVNRIRVERSKEYLKQKDQSILDVALNVGFNNQNYYCTIFKRVTNMTPTEFRQKMVMN